MAKANEIKTAFDEYFELAQDFKNKTGAALAEINKCKSEVMQMKTDIMNRINDGQFLWDNKRIVISAPEIIIGNVNKNGDLQDNGGTVLIKGGALTLHGVGDGGNVTIKAPHIEQSAVNPGIDGAQDVVGLISSIVSTGRRIQLVSQSPQYTEENGGQFLPYSDATEGVSITSEKEITLSATNSKKSKTFTIWKSNEKLKDEELELTEDVNEMEEYIKGILKKMRENIQKDKSLTKESDLTKSNIHAIDELSIALEELVQEFDSTMNRMLKKISCLAEVNRKIACLVKEKEHLDEIKEESFEEESQGTLIDLRSEKINLHSIDGDNNWRTNSESGIDLRGNDIKIRSLVGTGELSPAEKQSRVTIQSRNVNISTANMTDPTFDVDKINIKTAKFPLEGNVTIQSKSINLESMDTEQTDENKMKETALTAGSEVNIRSEKVNVMTVNHEGKSVGKFSVNSQLISMEAANINDYKPELELDEQGNVKHPDLDATEVVKDSAMLLLAENMRIGFKQDEMSSKKTFLYGDESMQVGSKQTVETGHFDKDKMTNGIILSEEKIELKDNKTVSITGAKEVKVEGKTEFSDEVTAPNLEAKKVNVSQTLKTPSMKDGM